MCRIVGRVIYTDSEMVIYSVCDWDILDMYWDFRPCPFDKRGFWQINVYIL